ncbi:MAG: ribonuclease D [Granulosicoccus sp.]|nr:ribonuclease D [Granulosicoccus sp.]
MSKARDYLYIDNSDALSSLCQTLAQRPYIVVDTEFLRERTYRPELCLVQIKQEDVLACIDTLAVPDLSPLIDLLMNTQITKVFHAASQDLEIFYLICKAVPSPIFDTQLAAPLLGYDEQIGYANLVSQHLNVSLAKTHTRADWTRRPLPASQIEYALDDVVYLEALYQDMHRQLTDLGRIDWLKPEFEQWQQPEKYDQPAAERWKKIRNVNKFKGPSLSVIQQLAKWREIKARELNKPRNWLLKDDVLMALAKLQPGNISELSHIRGIDQKSRDRYGSDIVAVVNSAKKNKPDPLPPFVKKNKLDSSDRAKLQLLNTWVHQRASDLKIAPGLLVPAKTLERLIQGDRSDALKGWREPLVSDQLNKLLDGKASLSLSESGIDFCELPAKENG